MKYFLAIYALAVAATISILGFRGEVSRKPPLEIFPDMDRQLKLLEQSGNAVFADGSSDRMPPAHSVPRGNGLDLNATFSPDGSARDHLADKVFITGLTNGAGHPGFPSQLKVNEKLMREGKSQYQIYCSRCHGDLGNGNGVLSKFGLKPRNLTDPLEPNYLKLPDLPNDKHGLEGYVVHVIAEGKNTMLGLKDRVGPKQRWAIALYLNALRKWVESRDKPASEPVAQETNLSSAEDSKLIAQGKNLFQTKLCATCHQVNPSAPPPPTGLVLKAPSFIGKFWGAAREVHVGINGPVEQTTMNEKYFLESIEKPMAKIVKDTQPGMAPLPTTLKERKALMAYVKSLSKAPASVQASTTGGKQE